VTDAVHEDAAHVSRPADAILMVARELRRASELDQRGVALALAKKTFRQPQLCAPPRCAVVQSRERIAKGEVKGS